MKNYTKTKEVCAGSVLFYKDKILLLYNHRRKHFVQSQGHQKKNESLSQTALREAKEETGFKNLKVIKKLGKYQYHFQQGNKITFKTIRVYLIAILNRIKSYRTQMPNEKFSNHFFSIQKAIEKVQWKQDKKYIHLARKYLRDKYTLITKLYKYQ